MFRGLHSTTNAHHHLLLGKKSDSSTDSDSSDSDSGDSDSSTDSDSDHTVSSSSRGFVAVNDLPVPRQVVAPLDIECNQLSFQVDTRHHQEAIGSREEPEGHGVGKDVGDSHVETFRITRAMIEEAGGRGQIKIYVVPGPETPRLQEAVTSTWYHISARQLDFSRFRDVCLTIPHLSDRLRKLTSEMLNKVNAEKVKPFDSGMFIEPGTVLRADESNQPDPQSVIFSCLLYLGLHPQARSSAHTENTLFSQRTLMQTFYPYEPVRERDAEQSYKRFGNGRSESIIHVPNLWMMNIGSSFVVTCGHAPLSKEMINSMAIIEEEIIQLGTQPVADNNQTKIRLTDRGGRDFIFPLSTCRSYLQMEARVREIEYGVNGKGVETKICLQRKTRNDSSRVTPKHWKNLIARNNFISINLVQVTDKDVVQMDPLSTSTANAWNTSSSTSVPPFFHWPQPNASTDTKKHKTADRGLYKRRQFTSCLEQVEKAMMTDIIIGVNTNRVDATFASTNYYESLPEVSYESADASFSDLREQLNQGKRMMSGSSLHHVTVDTQHTGILNKSLEFFNFVRMISELFVSDTDESTVIDKTWGVMARFHEHIVKIEDNQPSDRDSDQHSTSRRQRGQPHSLGHSWIIRTATRPSLLSIPDGKPELTKAITKCKRCSNFRPFDSLDKALRHLEHHANPENELAKPQTANTRGLPDEQLPAGRKSPDSQLREWVMTSAKFWYEQTNAGVLAILTMACTSAKEIFDQAQELLYGVQNEKGQISELYRLPKELPEAFRLILVFVMAIERALYDINDAYGQSHRLKHKHERDVLPYSKKGLTTLKRFSQTAIRSLRVARSQLCYMARSNPPLNLMAHLSLGPEYICAWLVRRLSLQPLEKQKSAGDPYREYISRLQFQVNHHPSKRLLRDLNLIQEELQILTSINIQQANLGRNYLGVLDDLTYEKESPSRKSMFPHERTLVEDCLDSLDLVREDYKDLIRRCGPLADRTKQSLEINEEDHGKAIMVFTVVTVIFLPLSFVTSYMGMNTVDIRDMNQGQDLFWIVAIPLTVVTVGICLLIGYNGDGIRDTISSLYRRARGKEEISMGGGGISVPRRKRPLQLQANSSSTLESSFPNEAEFASPRPVFKYSGEIYTGIDARSEDEDWYAPRHEAYSRHMPKYRITTEGLGNSRMLRRHGRGGYYPDHYGDNAGGHYDSYPMPPPWRPTYDVYDGDSIKGRARRYPQAQIYVSRSALSPWSRAFETEPLSRDEAELYSWGKKRSDRRHEDRRRHGEREGDEWSEYGRDRRARTDERDEYRMR